MRVDNQQLRKIVENAISERVFPGCVIGVISKEGKMVSAFGHFTYEKDARIVEDDTVYDCASITKSIPVASLALQFINEGILKLGDFARTYIPELKNDHGATIEDLLRYRVQGPRLSTLRLRTFEEVRTHILETGFKWPPGNAEYSNVPAYILGIILERVSGRSLPLLAHDAFFGPFAMNDTTFFPAASSCAPTELDGQGIRICGIVHDESARIFVRARRVAGHAGLFSTAPDLLEFIEALLNNRLPAVVAGAQQGLGWEVNQSRFMGSQDISGVFGKTGFTGTSVLVDVTRGTGLVILSNRTFPHRAANQEAINSVRSQIADLVLG